MAGKEEMDANITHVLSIHDGLDHHVKLLTPSPNSPVVSKQILIRDRHDHNLIEHFPGICAFIQDALRPGEHMKGKRNNVLVHCYAGVSRSASAILAYLIWSQYLHYGQALATLQEARPIVRPAFERQLMAWQTWLDDAKKKGISLELHAELLGPLKRSDKMNRVVSDVLEQIVRPPRYLIHLLGARGRTIDGNHDGTPAETEEKRRQRLREALGMAEEMLRHEDYYRLPSES